MKKQILLLLLCSIYFNSIKLSEDATVSDGGSKETNVIVAKTNHPSKAPYVNYTGDIDPVKIIKEMFSMPDFNIKNSENKNRRRKKRQMLREPKIHQARREIIYLIAKQILVDCEKVPKEITRTMIYKAIEQIHATEGEELELYRFVYAVLYDSFPNEAIMYAHIDIAHLHTHIIGNLRNPHNQKAACSADKKIITVNKKSYWTDLRLEEILELIAQSRQIGTFYFLDKNKNDSNVYKSFEARHYNGNYIIAIKNNISSYATIFPVSILPYAENETITLSYYGKLKANHTIKIEGKHDLSIKNLQKMTVDNPRVSKLYNNEKKLIGFEIKSKSFGQQIHKLFYQPDSISLLSYYIEIKPNTLLEAENIPPIKNEHIINFYKERSEKEKTALKERKAQHEREEAIVKEKKERRLMYEEDQRTQEEDQRAQEKKDAEKREKTRLKNKKRRDNKNLKKLKKIVKKLKYLERIIQKRNNFTDRPPVTKEQSESHRAHIERMIMQLEDHSRRFEELDKDLVETIKQDKIYGSEATDSLMDQFILTMQNIIKNKKNDTKEYIKNMKSTPEKEESQSALSIGSESWIPEAQLETASSGGSKEESEEESTPTLSADAPAWVPSW